MYIQSKEWPNSWLVLLTLLLLPLAMIVNCADKSTDATPSRTDRPNLRVPEDYANIQAAIDSSADGDTVLVADGIYIGSGNTNLLISGKRITLKSANGPRSTVIDCGGSESYNRSGISFEAGANSCVVDGFCIKNGYINHGGAIHCRSSSPIFKNCVFADNTGSTSGGAVRCKDSSPRFVNCTFVGNSSPAGGGLFLIAQSSPVLENCIIVSSAEGGALYLSDAASNPTLICCDLYGNVGGDWEGRIGDQLGTEGNFSADPQFCDAEEGDYRIRPESPCTPENSSCGTQIGIAEPACSDL
jgi:predicted outer membrane repeat protein